MYIHNNNLTIRTAVVEDAEILTSWWNDGKIMAHAGFPNGLNQSIEETINQINKNRNSLSQRCIIEVDGNRIGEASYRIYDKEAEIGIKICDCSYQNQGIGTTLLKMLIEFLFTDKMINKQINIDKIILDTNQKNERAQHVYEKIGFTKLRVNENAWLDQLGEQQSSIDYEMTREYFEKYFEKTLPNGVQFVMDKNQKVQIAMKILHNLPDWFGLPESTANYINESQTMPFWAYYEENEALGFVSLKETSKYTAEIYVMGVLKKNHGQGIGKKLFKEFYHYAKIKGYEFLQVKTVDEGHYEEYDKTRLFYEAIGFKKLETFPTLWDEWNPCLIMVMAVK